ncbi:MAG: hypothetical protein ACFBZ8_07405 [Opitutales bacterium]
MRSYLRPACLLAIGLKLLVLPACGPSKVTHEGGVRIFSKNEARTVHIYAGTQAKDLRTELQNLTDALENVRRDRTRLTPPEPGSDPDLYTRYRNRLEAIRTAESEAISRWERFLQTLTPIAEATTIEFGYFTVELPSGAECIALVLRDDYAVPDRLGALFDFKADGETYIQLGSFARINSPKP